MAKNFAASLLVPFKGTASSQPVKYCGDGKAVVLNFRWREYGTYIGSTRASAINPGVTFDVNRAPMQVLPDVLGVFIDNVDVSSPVYLVCDDTGHTVTCPDGSSAFFPLMTNGTSFTLYIESVDVPYQNSEQTRVVLMDKAVPPYSDFQFEQFVPASQVSGTKAYATQVQGDQYAYDNSGFSITTGGNWETSVVLLGAVSNTTLVITNVYLGANNLKSGSERQFAITLVHQGQEIFRQRFFARPYEVPGQTGVFVGSQNHPLALHGIAVRLNGASPLYATYRALTPANSAAPNAIFVPDVHVVYARLQNPTT